MAQGGGFQSTSWKASIDSSSEDGSDPDDDGDYHKRSSKRYYQVFVSNCTNPYTIKVTFQDQMDGTVTTGGFVMPHMKESIKFGKKKESRKMNIIIEAVLSNEQELNKGQIVMEGVNNKAGLIFTDEMKVVYAKTEPFIRNWWRSVDGRDCNPHHSRDDKGNILRKAPNNKNLNIPSTMLLDGNKCLVCADSKQARKKDKIVIEKTVVIERILRATKKFLHGNSFDIALEYPFNAIDKIGFPNACFMVMAYHLRSFLSFQADIDIIFKDLSHAEMILGVPQIAMRSAVDFITFLKD